MHKQTAWLQIWLGIGEEHVQSNSPRSRLIYPLSLFGIIWIVLTATFLGYTAVVTPPVIAFHWLDADCIKVPFCVDVCLCLLLYTRICDRLVDACGANAAHTHTHTHTHTGTNA